MITRSDRPFIEWARQRGCRYYYTDDTDAPAGSLKLFVGLLTVYIHQGKLVRIRADSSGDMIDQFLCDLSQLFGICAAHEAYPPQARCRH